MIRSKLLKNLAIASAMGMAAATQLHAATTDEAMRQLEAIMADDQRRQASYDAGHERIRFCGYCHGEDGNSTRDFIPNLAAQHPQYLFEQFEKFGDGRREDHVMSTLARALSLQERIDIAVYYSQQTARPREGADPVKAAAGQRIFQSYCFSCHGADAEGVSNMPRLAAQPAQYVEAALKRFRQMDPAASTSPMVGVARGLKDEDIAAVAAYLQGR